MSGLLSRLLRAAEWGAVLALGSSCGGQTEGGSAATSGGSAGATSGGGSGGAGGSVIDAGTGGAPVDSGSDADDGGVDGSLPTTPYPTPAGCFGPFHDGGYYGQCCEKVTCTGTTDGACPPYPVPGPGDWPVGSGYCGCGTTASSGPFAPQNPSTEGPCCYVYSTIGCDGRPLIVRGTPRLAPLRRRSDWGCPGSPALAVG
ncbi:MAG: hypothetical protein AMXMBFR56_27200 [Polyangiaceae bacterium]